MFDAVFLCRRRRPGCLFVYILGSSCLIMLFGAYSVQKVSFCPCLASLAKSESGGAVGASTATSAFASGAERDLQPLQSCFLALSGPFGSNQVYLTVSGLCNHLGHLWCIRCAALYICFSTVAVLLPVPALCTLVGFLGLFSSCRLFFARVGAPSWPRDLCCILIECTSWVGAPVFCLCTCFCAPAQCDPVCFVVFRPLGCTTGRWRAYLFPICTFCPNDAEFK